MLHLPSRFTTVILNFAPLFFQSGWRHAEVLLPDAILAPGTRTVSSLPRITGLARERHFVNYHRVLNRTVWSPRAAAGILFRLLLAAFVPRGPVLLGLDDIIERRRGARIAAIEFLAALWRHDVTCIARLRQDAAPYTPAPPRQPGAKGRPRETGARSPNLSEALNDAETVWRHATIPGWYGRRAPRRTGLRHRRVAPRRPPYFADPLDTGMRPARPVLPGHLAGRPAPRHRTPRRCRQRLVSQVPANL